MEEKDGYDILAKVRDILLPLVEPTDPCGDYGTCTVSRPECMECLAKKIASQYETLRLDNTYLQQRLKREVEK